MLLSGKVAVVTGSNRGIGRAIVEAFARNGADVWACARRADDGFARSLETLAAETGRSLTPLYFDLSDDEAVKSAGKTIVAAKRPVDVLVNNAGVIHTALFQMTPIEKMRDIFETNLFAALSLTQYVLRLMTRQRSGSIINISSSAALEGNAGRSAYAASKAALICATRVIANEVSPYGIRVNALAPGLTDTEMMTSSTPEPDLKATVARTALRRVAKPAEIANAALFLASDLSSFVTGQVLRADGGL